ncbi:MAG: FxLYD domain-containing protein [Dehalococcoidia bacterium]
MIARILFLLVVGIAVLAGTAAEDGNAAAQSGGVEIVSTSSYESITGSLHLVGEVANNTESTIEYVKIIVAYYAADGALVATDFTYTEMDELQPGETSPFDILTIDPPAGIDRHELLVEYDDTRQAPLRGFETSVGSVRTSSIGSLRITGEVQNNTGVAAEYVKVIAALYDADGRVIRVDFTFSERDEIEPGGRSPFEVLIIDAPAYSSYKLWVDGLRVD